MADGNTGIAFIDRLRRRQDEGHRSVQVHAEPDVPVTLSERIWPMIVEAEQAIDRARVLQDENSALHADLRFHGQVMEEQAERIDDLERSLKIAQEEAIMLRSRMQMFGEAAGRIVDETQKAARDKFEPPPRQQPHNPGLAGQPRPVRVVAPHPEDDVEPVPVHMRALAATPRYS